jgi:subfamily B ATP-binding cassette protein MsbA
MRRKDLSSPLTEFLAIIVVAALLVLGGSLVFRDEFSASTFVIFITMFYNIIDPAKSFSNSYYSIQKGSAAIDRIEELLSINNDIKNDINAEHMLEFSKEIKFKQVNFSYDKDIVLNNINFSINKGETVAFVGGSGAGKSTIAQLIPRFWDTKEGAIFFDGKNVKNYTLESLREKIAFVSQENILFNDTIRNNICFGTHEESDNLAHAIHLACVDEFISDLRNGIDENIGENGLKLSGGQRQRIALARAIYRNRPILVLDEATASLDYETEKIIQKNLNGLNSVTKIIIAHRISTIQDADKIFVIQKGQIVESGTHDQLINLNMHYKKLYDLQNN